MSTIQQTYQIFQSKQKLKFLITVCIALFIVANVLLDFSFTLFQNSSFYITESLLFSSYWLLYLPLLTVIFRSTKPLLILSAIVFHLFAYAALVWIISSLFYEHTFAYWQTFNYGLSAYFIKTVLIYGFSFVAFSHLHRKTKSAQTFIKPFISAILIANSTGKKLVLQVNEIRYFAANSPYVSVYHTAQQYLHTETLKSLESQLDDKQFVRIHKSHIVNIHQISAIQSRQNGDYDITLSDSTILRVSRNYAKDFKSKLEQHTTQLITK
jgi:two-component system response regulator LytT